MDPMMNTQPFINKMKMTPQEIFEYKNTWKPKGFQVDVHSDLDVQCKHWCRGNLNRWEWSMDTYTDVYMSMLHSQRFRFPLHRWEWSMDTYTDVYSHSFYFEEEQAAAEFTRKFQDWVDKGKG